MTGGMFEHTVYEGIDEAVVDLVDDAALWAAQGVLDEMLFGGMVLAGGLALADRYRRRKGRRLQRGVYVELLPLNGEYESPEELRELAEDLRVLADEVEQLL